MSKRLRSKRATKRRQRKASERITIDMETRSRFPLTLTLAATRLRAFPGERIVMIHTPSYYDVPWVAQARWDHSAADFGIIEQATLTKLQHLMDEALRVAIVGARPTASSPSTETASDERRKTQRTRPSDRPDREDRE
jgi:hypothetical protein